MDQQMYKMLVSEHYKFPHNKVGEDFQADFKMRAINPSCGDQIILFANKLADDTYEFFWSGSGCSICCASTSIMMDEINHLTAQEIETKTSNFGQILLGNEDQNQLYEQAQIFSNLKNFPSRFKCANLAWQCANDLVNQKINKISN